MHNPDSLVDICIPVICRLVKNQKLELMDMNIPETLLKKIKCYYDL